MKNKEGYIPKADRKKILLLCDDIRMHSGVATMAREFVVGSAHHYNWFNLGAAVNHPEVGKVMDLSADVNKTAKLDFSQSSVLHRCCTSLLVFLSLGRLWNLNQLITTSRVWSTKL